MTTINRDDNTLLCDATADQLDRVRSAANEAGHPSLEAAANGDGGSTGMWNWTVARCLEHLAPESDADRTQRLYREAESRVRGDDRLAPFAGTILADFPEGDDHWQWVIDADADEIIGWAKGAAR